MLIRRSVCTAWMWGFRIFDVFLQFHVARHRLCVRPEAFEGSSTSTSLLSPVLALPDLAEFFHLGLSLHAEPLLDGGDMRTQEGIGLQLDADGGRQRRLAGGAELIDLLGALLQRLVLRLDGQRELGIGPACTRAAIDGRVLWAAPSASAALPHHLRVALDHAAAADGEQRVAGEGDLGRWEAIGDVAGGVAGVPAPATWCAPNVNVSPSPTCCRCLSRRPRCGAR